MRFNVTVNPPIEFDVTSTKVYYGQASHFYNGVGSPKTLENITSGFVDLNPEGMWFLAAKFTDTDGDESTFGEEIVFRFKTAPVSGGGGGGAA
jgi:hypothetical protein